MLNQLMSISFALFYLVTSIGVQVNVHYCMDEVKSVELFTSSYKCCCSELMDMDCCGSETILIQAEDDERIISNYQFAFQSVISISEKVEIPFVINSICSQKEIFGFSDSSPPPKRSLWLLNCSLTYYG